jgi:general secretion pathway protein L
LLERSLTLPLAAERDLARVLGYEIDRVTPFSVDEIFWRCAVEQRDRANARLSVRLSLIPKAAWSALLNRLAAVGLRPGSIEVARPDGAICRIDLDAAASSPRALVAAAALCGALAVAAIVLPFILQAVALGVVEERIAALRPAVAEADALRQRIASGASGIDVMAAEQSRVGDVLAVLTAVTAALPDDTYLTSLSLREGHLSLAGQSEAAAKLIGALSGESTIRDAAFDAPVTRSAAAPADQFSIRADIATGAGR